MASDLVERLKGMAREFVGQTKPNEAWVSALTEAMVFIRALRRELDATRTALAEQSRLNEEMKAEAYRRGVEDAAKVAGAEADSYALHCDTYARDVAVGIAAAIRSLPADKGDAQ